MISLAIPEQIALGAAAALTLPITLLLLIALIQKEISGEINDERAGRLSQALTIVIIPLSVVFVVDAIMMVGAVLR